MREQIQQVNGLLEIKQYRRGAPGIAIINLKYPLGGICSILVHLSFIPQLYTPVYNVNASLLPIDSVPGRCVANTPILVECCQSEPC